MNVSKHVVQSSKKHKRKRSRSRQSTNTIHITLRSSSVKYSHSHSYRSRSVLQQSSTSITDGIQSSFKKSSHRNFVKNDTVDTYHRQRKKNRYFRQSILFSICTTVILCIMINIIIVLVLFIKHKFNRTPEAILRWRKDGITVAGNVTSVGANSDQLNSPWHLVLVWPNILYASEWGNNRVQKFILGSSQGETVAGQSNGLIGSNLTQFKRAIGIVVDEYENIYVADSENHRIQFWSKDKSTITTIVGTTGKKDE